jgi:hypothetical protein
MEAVTELGLCNQIISSIKTQEGLNLAIYFGFSSVGRKRGKRMALHNINQTLHSSFLSSSLHSPGTAFLG